LQIDILAAFCRIKMLAICKPVAQNVFRLMSAYEPAADVKRAGLVVKKQRRRSSAAPDRTSLQQAS
jgi:hypothetical protein